MKNLILTLVVLIALTGIFLVINHEEKELVKPIEQGIYRLDIVHINSSFEQITYTQGRIRPKLLNHKLLVYYGHRPIIVSDSVLMFTTTKLP